MDNELAEARRELDYLRSTAERTIAGMLRLDTSSVVLRHELEQKRRGFALMAELAANLGRTSDYRSIFISAGRRINAALNMQRTAVLTPDENGVFKAVVLQGYPVEDEERLASTALRLEAELLDPERPVLVTGADPEERLAAFRKQFALPYFISLPVVLNNDVAAVLVTGRMVEQIPYLTRLGQGDLETTRAIGACLAAMLAGQRVAEVEKRTRLMLDSMPLGCNFWDRRGRLIDCNQEAVRLLGFSDKQEYLAKFYTLSPDVQPDGRSSRERELELIERAFSSGFARTKWMYLPASGEEPVPFEVTFVRVRSENTGHVLAYMRDLRKVKTVLAEVRMTENALRKAKDLAEKHARAKSAFMANMSHELHTPMNGILGMLRFLNESGLTERQREFVDKADYSARRLLEVIDDILDFSAIEGGSMRLERKEFFLRETAERALQVPLTKALAKNLTFAINVAPEVPEIVLGDARRFAQILFNLADNAVKFTETGKVEVHFSPVKIGHDCGIREARVFCEVIDTGPGVDEDRASELFRPFDQDDSSSARRYGGVGLGLAICSRLVEMMGGALHCGCGIKHGSVFSFEIPFGLPEGSAVMPPVETVEEEDVFAVLRGMRVLLAEDNEINRMIAVELLNGCGVITDTAVNGREALEALAHTAYDVVLMDIQMPEMDGLTAARLIRAAPEFRDVPILAMTAHATDADRELSLEAGMNEHLTKPIEPDELFAALLRWGRGVEQK